jgi:hypothetical protein
MAILLDSFELLGDLLDATVVGFLAFKIASTRIRRQNVTAAHLIAPPASPAYRWRH